MDGTCKRADEHADAIIVIPRERGVRCVSNCPWWIPTQQGKQAPAVLVICMRVRGSTYQLICKGDEGRGDRADIAI